MVLIPATGFPIQPFPRKYRADPVVQNSDKQDPNIEAINRKYIKGQHKTVRPSDASTVILIDCRSGQPRMLMGKRNSGVKFMPGVFVFPGGRVETADGLVPHIGSLNESDTLRLARYASGISARRIRALALAAIRETFEETGLRIGAKPVGPVPAKGSWRKGTWDEFVSGGLVPSVEGLHFMARAITPPGRSRRFDTRFFVLDISAYADDMIDRTTPDSELVELRWVTLEEAMTLETVEITRIMLEEFGQQAMAGFPKETAKPLLRARYNRFERVQL